MGYGDKPELTPSDSELIAAEERTRRLLARYGEPAPVEPPPGLASRVVAALPPARQPLRPLWRRPAAWASAAAAALLLALATLGALGLGAIPASVAGSPDTLLGRLSLTIAQTARPLSGLITGAGLVALLIALALAGGLWLWLWRRGSRKRAGG